MAIMLLLLLLLAMSMVLGLAHQLSNDWEGLEEEERRGVLAWLELVAVVTSVEKAHLCPADLRCRDIVTTRAQHGPGKIKLWSTHPTSTLAEDATLSTTLRRMLHAAEAKIARWRREFAAEASLLQREIEALQASMPGERPSHGSRRASVPDERPSRWRQRANIYSERPSRRSHRANMSDERPSRWRQRANIYGDRPSRRSHGANVSDQCPSRWRDNVPHMVVTRDRSETGFEQQMEEIVGQLNEMAIQRTRLSVQLPGSDVSILHKLLLRECTATHGGRPFPLQFGFEVKARQEAVLQHVNVLLPQNLEDPINKIKILIS